MLKSKPRETSLNMDKGNHVEDKNHNRDFKKLRIALVGNPNCGKTTLFNQLTGSSQYVGNWPGVTVEKKEGKFKYKKRCINVIDLPGIYSLSPYSPEEIVTRNCIIDENPDFIINIVDATNIERNLYLTTQVAELGRPMIIALNMIDLLEKRGDIIDYKLLEKKLGIPIVPISASKCTGLDELIDRSLKLADGEKTTYIKNIYSKEVDLVLKEIELSILQMPMCRKNVSGRWLAVKLFEGDNIVLKQFNFNEIQANKIAQLESKIETDKYLDREMIIADQRYKYICSVCNLAIKKGMKPDQLTLSDKIDKFFTNRFLAIPIFLSFMLIIFFITFGPFGNFLKNQAQGFISGYFSDWVLNIIDSLGASVWSKSLVVDGIIAGVGSVVSFLPQILILFALLSILEDSGYMARAAFIMDQLLRKIGLSGRAFVPMLMGFGCTVPAVLGTRILENKKDKLLTILITPFMSCSAKMPVYALFISTFFVGNEPIIIFSIYLLGIVVAILTALLFKNTILKGEPASFVMELPAYRLPTLKSLLLHVWERIKDFLVKAGTVLLAATIVIWFLQSFSTKLQMVEDSSQSILANIGIIIAPLFTLCGFADWRAAVSLITGIAAKESIVSTMSILYNTDPNLSISQVMHSAFSPISAYAFMVFVLLYTPCVAALSAIYKETGSIKWTLTTILYQLAVAWFASAFIFQFATLFTRIF